MVEFQVQLSIASYIAISIKSAGVELPKIFSLTSFFPAVYYGSCTCGRSVHYDGGDDGVLNMGQFLVSHRLMNDYLHSFLLDGSDITFSHKLISKCGILN